MTAKPDFTEVTTEALRSRLSDVEASSAYRRGVVYAMSDAYNLRTAIKARETAEQDDRHDVTRNGSTN